MPLIKILEGRQSIPEMTHIFDYDNPSYLSGGDVNLEVWGYSFNNLPNRDRANNEYKVYIGCTSSTTMFSLTSKDIDLFPDLTVGGDRSLAVLFPKFKGFETTFNVITENKMTVYIPPVINPGCFEIILLNRAGYTSSAEIFGKYACTQDGLDDDYVAPIGLLRQSGANLIQEGDGEGIILIQTGLNPQEEVDRYAGDTPCC
jgi:hypothetical protein